MVTKSIPNFYFFSLSPTGDGISGGDRIFIELARYWSKKLPVQIYTTPEGTAMVNRFKLSGRFLQTTEVGSKVLLKNFLLGYIYKIYLGIKLSLELTVNNSPLNVVYSASDFWMDSLPAFILKLRCPKIIWVAAWYQTAPTPVIGFTEGRRGATYKFRAFLYWISQILIKPLINQSADFVIVNNEIEKNQFEKLSKKNKVLVMYAGVDITKAKKHQQQHKNCPKIYDAVFQGRFHPQKGVLELIQIWKIVVARKPDAKLIMIGDGPLMFNVKKEISRLSLGKNIKLLGYIFNEQRKFKLFSQSKIAVHPAFFDSGGMSAVEAMAFGLPCIGFKLKSFNSYYPKGMIKVEIGDLNAFASVILRFLEDENYRFRIGEGARQMIDLTWSWEHRASMVINNVFK